MRIMGIDPGTIKMGVGLIEKQANKITPLFYTTLHVAAKKGIHERLKTIYNESIKIFDEWKPDIIALEDVFYGKSFRSAIRIGEARSAVILAAMNKNIAIVEYAPAKVKSAVSGSGRAVKVQVQNMVKHILRLKELPPFDSADALAVAITHSNHDQLY